MKEMRRILALVLCFVMLVGYLPVNALAADDVQTVTETTEASSEPTENTSGEADAQSEDSSEDSSETVGGGLPFSITPGSFSALTGTSTASSAKVTDTYANSSTESTVEALDAAIFCSDVHGSTSDLTSVLKGVASSGVTYSSVGFVGDTCLTVANTESTVNSGLGYTPNVMFSYAASHDTENSADISTNWNYSGEVENVSTYYLVYTIRETDMQNSSDASTAAPAFTTWYNSLTAAEKALPIFIMSHRPLHDRRDDNAGAATWYSAISAAAESSDITFFWGHNHTKEDSTDTDAYYVAKDGTEKFTVYGGPTEVPNFTYMNAGYINANGQNPARKGIATTVQITADSLIFQDYNSSGEYSGSYAHNVTVAREFAASEPEVTEPTLESIAVTTLPTKTEYTVGEAFDVGGMVVTAYYSDGSEETTLSHTVSEVDMSTAGTKTVTVTYEGLTTSFEITVSEAETEPSEPTENTVTGWDDTESVTIQATALGLTDISATNVSGDHEVFDDVYTDHMAFDIALEGHTDGNSVKYSILVVENMDTTNMTVYYLAEDGSIVEIPCEVVTDAQGNQYVEFTTTYVGTFAYGSPVVPEGYTLTALTLANIPTDVFQGAGIDLTEAVITATYTKEGAEDFVRTLTVYDYDETNFSDFDVNVIGKQTVVFTFEGKEASLDIYVWGKTFLDETTGITVEVGAGEYGVDSVAVASVDTASVADAIADVIKGDNYVVYDITLAFAENYPGNDAEKTVTLPVSEDVTNPVVFHVSDDGEIEKMPAVRNEDGTVTFTTTHFSKFVVGESSMVGEVEDAEVPGNSTTTTVNKNVYVLTDSVTAGDEVLIVNANSSSGYILGSNTDDDNVVTIKTGNLTVNDTTSNYTYIDDHGDGLVWTVGSGMTFTSGNYKLGVTVSSGLWTSYSLTTEASSNTNWTYNNYTLQNVAQSRYAYYQSSNYYSRWTLSENSRNVYIYKKVTATETTTTGTQTATYGLNVTLDGTATQAITASYIKEGDTKQLGTAFTTTVSGQYPTGGAYTWTSSKENVATVSNDGLVTFTGVDGETLIQVTYTWTENGETYTVSNYVAVSATGAVYNVEISQDGTTAANNIIAQRNVKNGTTMQLSALPTVQTDDNTVSAATPSETKWYIYLEDGSDASDIATIDQTGKLTFTGEEGTVKVMVATTFGTKTVNDIVTVHVRQSNTVTPEESTTDFPRWPNPGAVRFDKTASAVGNFSETGIAQVELSLAGIPTGGNKPFDVVLVLDLSNSMQQSSRTTYLIAAAKAFMETICLNEDGTWNELDHGVSVISYNLDTTVDYPANTTTSYADDMKDISSLNDYNDVIEAIDGLTRGGGTHYAEALKHGYEVLNATKDPNRDQYLIFMSDGAPTSYAYLATSQVITSDRHTESTIKEGVYTDGGDTYNAYLLDQGTSTGSNYELTTSTLANYDEYYSYLMKQNGVEIYSVGLAITDSNDKTVISHISSAEATETATADNSHTFFISDGDSTALTNAFVQMGETMMSAATNVMVEDVVTDEYEIVFELPSEFSEAEADKVGLTNQEFYFEVVEYPLNETTHERTGVTYIKQRIYLQTGSNGVYISKIVEENTATEALGDTTEKTYDAENLPVPVYTAKEKDTDKAYFDADGKYYPNGDGTHHMTSGAKVELNENGSLKALYTVNFIYTVAEKKLNWAITSMSQTSETALRYFVYLEDSGGVEPSEQVEAGTYPTNTYANLTYTNHKGTECEQKFPVPQLTWNGAQVSYVFYLVNENGQPVNRAGREVTFAEAVFVTDVHTYAITWNDLEQAAGLEAVRLAEDLIPEDYNLYDPSASYKIHVYEDEKGVNLNNHFIIDGTDGDKTTYVYNNKTDLVKYNEHGAYAANTIYWCKSYNVNATVEDGKITAATYYGDNAMTQVLFEDLTNTTNATQIEGYAYYIDENGDVYTIVQNTRGNKISNFDFGNTTVAFAVVWERKVVDDTVVVDYGLPVDVDVVANDFVYNYITGISAKDPGTKDYVKNTGYIPLNDGTYTGLTAQSLNVDGHYARILDENKIHFIPGTTITEGTSGEVSTDKTMEFAGPVEIYYETTVEAYENDTVVPSAMYAKLTVIPATTVYYEDDFVSFTNSSAAYEADGVTYGKWTTDGETVNANQSQDRPGASQISSALDSDSIYGYDKAYEEMSTYSLGSAQKVTVNAECAAKASFAFYGTGFDVISLTSNDTGMIIVNVTDANGTMVRSLTVDTFYGMEANGTVSENNPDALYQVPVMKVAGLPYGKYTVDIIPSYAELFDHYKASSYDFYLDAIRIYDPTGVVSGAETDKTVSDAYIADGEGWPVYQELRSNVIAASDFQADAINGLVFIDAVDKVAKVSDYTNFGPNNELYLAKGQAVAFKLDLSAYGDTVKAVRLGMKNATETHANYVIVDGTKLENGDDLTGAAKTEISTTTDMYYDITAHKDELIVIYNAGEGILSLTDIKVTFTEAHNSVSDLFYVDYKTISNVVANLQKVDFDNTESDSVEVKDETGKVTVTCAKRVVVGETFNVTVTTTEEAEKVTVNGMPASSVDGMNWTAVLTATVEKNPMTVKAEATFEDAEGTATAVTAETEVGVAPAVLEVTVPSFVQAKDEYTISIKTSSDATNVKVGDNNATKQSDGPWTMKLKAVDTAGVSTVKLSVEATNGVATTQTEATFDIAVYTLSVVPSSDEVAKNEALKLTVTTSDNVEKVSVKWDDEVVNIATYRTNGNNRIWTAELALEEQGEEEITVYASNADAQESVAATVTVTVTENEAAAAQQAITTIIKTIVANLKTWLGWK